MPYLHHEQFFWCFCKAFAYNITALRGVIASKRAMSSILSSLLTTWNRLRKKWNHRLNSTRIFRVSIVFSMTFHRWFCSIFTDFLHHSRWQQVWVKTIRKPLKCFFIGYHVHITIIISWRVFGIFVRSFIAGNRYSNFWGEIACKFFLLTINNLDPFAGTLGQFVHCKRQLRLLLLVVWCFLNFGRNTTSHFL